MLCRTKEKRLYSSKVTTLQYHIEGNKKFVSKKYFSNSSENIQTFYVIHGIMKKNELSLKFLLSKKSFLEDYKEY